MQVERTLSVDEVFEQVKDYDLVFTSEASLADALNNRLEEPVLGEFAVTPMTYVLGENQNQELVRERGLFLELVGETDMSWKQVSYLLENIIECWLETGELEKILDYNRFDNESVREVIEVIRETENVYSEMQSFEIQDKDVAVVNFHQFNGLDRQVVPDRSDEYSVFTDEKLEVPEFRFFDSSAEIIQAVQENITEENAEDVAVVADPESIYSPLIKSALKTEGVPFMAQKGFSESESLRTFLKVLKLALTENVLVKDCRPVLTRLDIEFSVKKENDYLNSVEELGEFNRFLEELESLTFEEAVESFEEKVGEDCRELEDNLEEVGLLKENVDRENLNRLEYYLSTYDVEMDKTAGGVLIASNDAVAYVDRPVVFYLGMDSSWTSNVPDRPWIDQEKHQESNLKDFKTLIQNGEQQYFMVQERQMNEEVTPCLYFNELTDRNIESFSDLKSEENRYTSSKSLVKSGFEKEEYEVENQEVNTISQSSLNKLAYCPKDYLFSRLTGSPDQEYFRKGTLFHDFAELYVNHPDFVEEKEVEEFVELMVEEMSSIVDDLQLDILRTDFRVGIENIKEYLEDQDLDFLLGLQGFEKSDDENFFAEHYGKLVEKLVTEAVFDNPDIGVKGKADLLVSDRQILDYKSGSRKTESGLVRKSNLELIDRKPDFQAMLYLTQLRSVNPGEKLDFFFFHFLENKNDVVTGAGEMSDNLVTITYYPESFSDAIVRDSIKNYLAGANKRRRLIENLGDKGYTEVMEQLEISKEAQYDKEVLVENNLEEFVDLCEPRVVSGRGSGKLTDSQLEDSCRSLLKKLVKVRKINYFKEDLDRFEGFLEQELENLSQFQKGKFPMENSLGVEVEHSELDNGDMISR